MARRARALPLAAVLVLAAGFVWPGAFARHVLRTTLQGAALLAVFPWLIGEDHAIRRALCTRPAILIGRLSYSLYLWHWGAFAVADGVAGTNRALWLAIGVPLAVCGSVLSYWCVETPMLRLRRRFGSHAPLSISPEPVQEVTHAAD